MPLVGTDATDRSFEGTVGGEDGPWLVGVHVGRATPGDHVVAAGVHRYPVGTVDGGGDAIDGWQEALSRGRTFAVETGAQLEFP